MQSAALLVRSTALFSEAQAFPPKIGCAIDGRDSSCAADPNMLQIYGAHFSLEEAPMRTVIRRPLQESR
ncbi:MULTISPECIES: hypothetical protein [unclassified Bradyrhizobium]|uniref:hypothetical protein n=1 Tax=unclassified Bradyrhizobium TaxID=2631580 RepID=UPI003390C5B3